MVTRKKGNDLKSTIVLTLCFRNSEFWTSFCQQLAVTLDKFLSLSLYRMKKLNTMKLVSSLSDETSKNFNSITFFSQILTSLAHLSPMYTYPNQPNYIIISVTAPRQLRSTGESDIQIQSQQPSPSLKCEGPLSV